MIIADRLHYTQKEIIKGVWCCAKPLEFWTIKRFREAWDVFIGKAIATYFVEDFIKND